MSMTPESFTSLRQRLEKNGGSVSLPRGNPVHTPYPEMPGEKWEPKGIKKNVTITSKNLAQRPCAAEPQQSPENRALGKSEAKKAGPSRVVLCITAYRTRMLDPDNHAGGCKYLIDRLRYEKLLADDSPEHIELITRQVKVHSKEEIGTEITITEISHGTT